MGDRDRACRGCRFFGLGKLQDAGECRRYAPRCHIATEIDDPLEPLSTWPAVLLDDWCGEFEEKRQ
jgi:hypothetical protein